MAEPAESEIRRAAEAKARTVAAHDARFEPLARSLVGEPVLVRTVTGEASYWLVPMELDGRAVGFVRVTTDGTAVVAGSLLRDPDRLDSAPAVVTGITAVEASERVSAALGPDDVAESPVYVHDGPPGREAWLVRVRERAGGTRLLLVTTAGWYERAPDSGGAVAALER